MATSGQFVAQLISIITNIIFVFCISWVVFKIIDLIIGMRVSPETELAGLDIPEMGVLAYPDFAMAKTMRHETSNGEIS